MKIICFHNPDEEYGFLSNWYHSEFIVSEIVFSSMEQYMMYQKAFVFTMKKLLHRYLKQRCGRNQTIRARGQEIR